MITFYKGEDFTLTFTSVQDLSAYTKAITYFTPFGNILTAVITPIDNYSFSAKFASADTATLKAGNLNVVATFTDANSNKSISKTMPALILDAGVNGNVRDASMGSAQLEIVFEQNTITLDINFVGLSDTDRTKINNLPTDTNAAIASAITTSETYTNNQLFVTSTPISIGDSYGGGIVAYILQPGDPGYNSSLVQGLIVAPTDQGVFTWDTGTDTNTGATDISIGAGASNTAIIVAAVGAGTYAAKICSDLILGGFSDWYLPSQNELLWVYVNRAKLGTFNGTNTFYWDSTDGTHVNMAGVVDFSNGSYTTYAKSGSYNVRAMRSFSEPASGAIYATSANLANEASARANADTVLQNNITAAQTAAATDATTKANAAQLAAQSFASTNLIAKTPTQYEHLFKPQMYRNLEGDFKLWIRTPPTGSTIPQQTPITVAAIGSDTNGAYVQVNNMPYISELVKNPTNWGAWDITTTAQPDTAVTKITKITYLGTNTAKIYTTGTFVVGHVIGVMSFLSNGLNIDQKIDFPLGTGTWNQTYVTGVEGIWKRSDGKYAALVSGYTAGIPVAKHLFLSDSMFGTWVDQTPSGTDAFTATLGTTAPYLSYLNNIHQMPGKDGYYWALCLQTTNGALPYKGVYALVFDEFLIDVTLTQITIDASANFVMPTTVWTSSGYFNGKFMFSYRTGDSTARNGAAIVLASDGLNQPFYYHSTVYDFSIPDTMGELSVGQATSAMLTVINNELYAFCPQSSDDALSGNNLDHEIHLFKYDDKLGTWHVEATPIMVAYHGGDSVWGVGHTWGQDHMGAVCGFYHEDNKMYFGASMCNGTNTYQSTIAYFDLNYFSTQKKAFIGDITAEATARQTADATLQSNINTLSSKGYLYLGQATTSTVPAIYNSTDRVYYQLDIAAGTTTLTNFGSLVITATIPSRYHIKWTGAAWTATAYLTLLTTDVGIPSGIAGLDSSGFIPVINIPGFENLFTYGIEWDVTNPVTAATRIGNLALHAQLPIQSLMKGCLLLDNGLVNYYLNPTDWTKKADGTAALLDGTDGQVMVEVPAHYRTFYQNGNKQGCRISLIANTGYTYVPKWYISAYEAALDRTNLKLASVVNASTQYRGGDNNATVDAAANTRLGMPVTTLSRTQFRTYARARGSVNWNQLTYGAYNAMFWLYYVEYANLNSQLPMNAAKDANGCSQGGLGNGITDLDGTLWNAFNGYNPVVPCGASNVLGNGTGEVAYNMPSLYNATIKTTKVPRYRGIENPFGHIWKWMDGVNIEIQADSAGALSKVWIANTPADFSDSGYVNHVYVGNLARLSGYIIAMIPGTLLPLSVGGGSTTYWSDYSYTSLPATGESLRGLLFGGNAVSGSYAGLADASSGITPAYASAFIGSRLCYLGS